MGFGDLVVIAVSLSMDAFAVSICKGLSVRRVTLKHALTCGVWFGAGQALFPLAGYFLGSRFGQLMSTIGPWVAFVLLAIIGGNMVRESFGEEYYALNGGFFFLYLRAVSINFFIAATGAVTLVGEAETDMEFA